MVEIRIDLSEEEAKNLGHTGSGNIVTKENACIGVRFESDLTYSKDEADFVEYPQLGFADKILAEMAAAKEGWCSWCESWLVAKFLASYYEALPEKFFLDAGVTRVVHIVYDLGMECHMVWTSHPDPFGYRKEMSDVMDKMED